MNALPTLSSGLMCRLKLQNLNEPQRRIEIERLKKSLKELFEFLQKNQRYTQQIQGAYYRKVLMPWDNNADKVKALLQHTWKTQTQPKMDDVLPFWIDYQKNWECFNTIKTVDQLADRIKRLVPGCPSNKISNTLGPLDTIWRSLCDTPGFGPKTAALLTKAIVEANDINLHPNCNFLEDATLKSPDKMRVPVDTVIQFIFQRLTGEKLTFEQINELIFDVCGYEPKDSMIWDDLWFWGYITQVVKNQHGVNEKKKKKNRIMETNKAKFFTIEGAAWNEWTNIETLANKFIALLIRSSNFLSTRRMM